MVRSSSNVYISGFGYYHTQRINANEESGMTYWKTRMGTQQTSTPVGTSHESTTWLGPLLHPITLCATKPIESKTETNACRFCLGWYHNTNNVPSRGNAAERELPRMVCLRRLNVTILLFRLSHLHHHVFGHLLQSGIFFDHITKHNSI